jgi:hypothetical protein
MKEASMECMRKREFAYADVFRHPPVEGALFDERGQIRTDLDDAVATCCKNESNCTVFLNDGAWFTTWGQGRSENHPDESIVWSLSRDQGKTWTEPRRIVASDPENEERMAYGVPFVIPETDRIYMFFFVVAMTDGKVWAREGRLDTSQRRYPEHFSGLLHFVFSDDRGQTWSPRYPVPLPHRDIETIPGRPHAWLNHPPLVTPNGDVLLTFSSLRQRLQNWQLGAAECNVVHCENILTESDPEKLVFTLYPKGPRGIRTNLKDHRDNPSLNQLCAFFDGTPEDVGWNFQELTLAPLEDGRLLGIGRTCLGAPGYTVSKDGGRTWTRAEPLRYGPGRETIRHPMTMCPVAQTSDGRVVLLFTNNDGFQRGAQHVWDGNGHTRNPQWIVIGRQIPGEKENAGLVFGKPRILAEVDDSENTNLKTGISMPQFFERDGRYFVMYNINKEHILLDEIPAAIMNEMTPEG